MAPASAHRISFLAWIALAGRLLLVMALLSVYFRLLPVTSSLIYLALGMAVGPLGLNLIAVDFIGQRVNIEHLTEIAVIISLFVCGLKLPLPLSHPAWFAAFLLAGPVMLATISGVALFSSITGSKKMQAESCQIVTIKQIFDAPASWICKLAFQSVHRGVTYKSLMRPHQ